MPKHLGLLLLLGGLVPAPRCEAARPTRSFVQLNRDRAATTEAGWREDMRLMKDLGLRTIIVQWCAEPGILYTEADVPSYPERFATIERLLAAAAKEEMTVHLGLFHDPNYWTEITARDRVLRDYFLVRVAENERIQRTLLDRFRDCRAWVGYYIPDEIDDLTWRDPTKNALFGDYLRLLCERLRANDPDRTIGISAFVRGRTDPDVFAKTLLRIAGTGRPDRLLIQDGIGVGDPREQYLPMYYAALRKHWNLAETKLGCIVELFAQTSAPGEPFAAVPADPARVRRQLQHAAVFDDDVTFFTFQDYAHPNLGPEADALYKGLSAP